MTTKEIMGSFLISAHYFLLSNSTQYINIALSVRLIHISKVISVSRSKFHPATYHALDGLIDDENRRIDVVH